MSGIGNNNPFTPKTPHTPSTSDNLSSGSSSTNKTPSKQPNLGQKDTIRKTPELSRQQKEQTLKQEMITEVASPNPDSIVEEELQESETTNGEKLKEAKEQNSKQGEDKTGTEARRSPLNISKLTMNENGQQTDTPDDSIGHLANALMDFDPESLCEAAEVAANIISEDEDEEESDNEEAKESDDENKED